MKNTLLFVISLFYVISVSAQDDASAVDFAAELGKTVQLTPEQEKKIDAAFVALDAVQKAGNYVQSLTELLTDGKIPLPVGIVSKEGGYELIVHEISQKSDKPAKTIYATCAFTFKDVGGMDKGQRIAFEGQVTWEGGEGFGNSGKLTLIAPVRKNLGAQSTLVLREGTSVSFGCGGIESFDARLVWLVTSDDIIPVNAAGVKQEGAKLGVSFEAHFEDFDNYLISVDIDKRFAIKGLDDIIFSIRGATIDQSDTENAGTMVFPSNYFNGADLATQKLWKGVAVSEASVGLPAFFKQAGSADRVTLALNSVIFDENGFSGNASALNLIPSSAINPDSWAAVKRFMT